MEEIKKLLDSLIEKNNAIYIKREELKKKSKTESIELHKIEKSIEALEKYHESITKIYADIEMLNSTYDYVHNFKKFDLIFDVLDTYQCNMLSSAGDIMMTCKYQKNELSSMKQEIRDRKTWSAECDAKKITDKMVETIKELNEILEKNMQICPSCEQSCDKIFRCSHCGYQWCSYCDDIISSRTFKPYCSDICAILHSKL